MKPVRLTARNKEVVSFIQSFLDEYDRVPAMADIANHFGWSSDNAAHEHIAKLIVLGVLEKVGCWYRFKREVSHA